MRRSPVGLITLLVLAVACDDRGNPVGVEDPRSEAPPARSELLVDPGMSARTNVQLPVFAAPLPGGTVVYDAIPSPFPTTFPSLPYEMRLTDEWGDQVGLTEAGLLGQVTVGLNSYACENDATRAPNEACVSTEGATFSHPITLNLYEVDETGADPAVGSLIASRTTVFEIPFRPSYDTTCPPPAFSIWGGKWRDPVSGDCVDGLGVEAVFDFVGDDIVLPDQVIVSVAYDTESAGASPVGVPGPYNALFVGAAGTGVVPPPTVGTNLEDDFTFWDTDLAGFYCDGGAGGVDVFRRDGCWGGITPMVRIELGGPVDDLGPVASDIEALASTEVGGVLQVTAVVDDSETGGSNLSAAEMQLVPAGDEPADEGWTGAVASDGAFDSPTETVEGELVAPDGAALMELCVRGMDDAGNVGDPTCAPLAVVDPDGGSVTGGGWWHAVDDEGEPLGRAMLAFQAGYHPEEGGLMANLQMTLPGLRMHVRDFDWLVVGEESAALSGRVMRDDEEIEVLLMVGLNAGPGGEDTVELVVRSVGDEGETLFDSNGPQPLAGGSIEIHD